MTALSPKLCSVHTHSTLCDGADTLEAMAAAAFAAGVRYFGCSGHSHTPVPTDEGSTLPADLTAYRTEVLRLREVYRGRMEVLLGLEWDLCSDAQPEGLDYWIGSVHNLRFPESERYCTVDWKEELLASCRDECFGGDFCALTEAYYAEVAAVAALAPTILGHIDLITKLNGDGRFFDEEAPRYRAAALAALHAADPARTLLEINTGAIARGYRKTPYPAPFLLREWRAMGGKIILTADAHSAASVLYGYDEAAQAARGAGFSESVLLTADGPVLCPL